MNHNTHPEEQVLLAFFDEELAADKASQVKIHCESCAECQQILTDFAAVQEMVQSNIPVQKPQPVWSAVASKQGGFQHDGFQPALVFGTIAACAAGLALGLFMGEPQGGGYTNKGTEAWASADYLWSGTDSPSLFVVFSDENSQERSGES